MTAQSLHIVYRLCDELLCVQDMASPHLLCTCRRLEVQTENGVFKFLLITNSLKLVHFCISFHQ